jgi:hypothetical protein
VRRRAKAAIFQANSDTHKPLYKTGKKKIYLSLQIKIINQHSTQPERREDEGVWVL